MATLHHHLGVDPPGLLKKMHTWPCGMGIRRSPVLSWASIPLYLKAGPWLMRQCYRVLLLLSAFIFS